MPVDEGVNIDLQFLILEVKKQAKASASNLERCAGFFTAIAEEMQQVSRPDNFIEFNLKRYYKTIYRAIDTVFSAIIQHDLKLAQKICDYEALLDEYYVESFHELRGNLRQRRQVDDMLSLLTIVRYLERVGDSLLNIGEAILDIHVGEKMGILQFRSLKKGLESLGLEIDASELQFRSIMNTRSGCRVAKIITGRSDPEIPAALFY